MDGPRFWLCRAVRAAFLAAFPLPPPILFPFYIVLSGDKMPFIFLMQGRDPSRPFLRSGHLETLRCLNAGPTQVPGA